MTGRDEEFWAAAKPSRDSDASALKMEDGIVREDE